MTEIKIGDTWRHRQRGTSYTIMATNASLQCSSAPDFEAMFDDEYFIVYQDCKTGAIRVRPGAEFLDGRFEKMAEA